MSSFADMIISFCRELTEAISGFVINSLKKQLGFGIKRDVCFCLGTGKNLKFLARLNKEHHFFERIESLEHPRFIMQYRTNKKNTYIDKYIEKFSRT